VLGEFDRREVWASWECRSAQQWLSWKCGLGYTAATERLRVARVLPSLPAIGAALAVANHRSDDLQRLCALLSITADGTPA
jgi:hypothetical protein